MTHFKLALWDEGGGLFLSSSSRTIGWEDFSIWNILLKLIKLFMIGLPRWFSGKESTCNAWDLGSVPGLGRSLGEGKGYPLQYPGLENSMGCSPWGPKKGKVKVAQPCPALCNPMDCSLPGSSVHGIFQARVLECLTVVLSCISLVPLLSISCISFFGEVSIQIFCPLKNKFLCLHNMYSFFIFSAYKSLVS